MIVADESPRTLGEQDRSHLTRPEHHIVISPHYDDLSLSIGASVAHLSDAGRTVIDAVVFGSEPDPEAPLHGFAQELHKAWGLSAAEVIAARRAEELAATGILGARLVNLPFHDAIYRGKHYAGNDDLFGEIKPAESALPTAVAEAVMAAISGSIVASNPDPDTRFYAPLGIGRHVDHQVATEAGLVLVERGWDVWFYEDIPYSMIGSSRPDRIAELERIGFTLEQVATIPLSDAFDRKVAAVLSYSSQLVTVFTNYANVPATPVAIAAALKAYHHGVGNGTPAEAFWTVTTG